MILANDQVTVRGVISASGGTGDAAGSGGVLVLRSLVGILIDNKGIVRAVGATVRGTSFGSDGFVRLDAEGSAPVLKGSVTPTPKVTALHKTWSAFRAIQDGGNRA